MATMDLKNLNRKQLLELLLKQTKKVEQLQCQMKALEEQLAAEQNKVNEGMLIRELINRLEQQCLQRELEADRKIEDANKKIEEAERIIEKMGFSQNAQETEWNDVKNADNAFTSTGDALDDFFSSVIGK